MERNPSYGLMLSLKEISLRKVTLILWSQCDILASIYTLDVEQKIEDNMSKLNLPPLLTKEMSHLVKPIGTEIKDWNEYHQTFLTKSPTISLIHINIHILEHLCWNIFGAIDYRKSSEIIICYEMLDIIESYRLACFYCIDDSIPVLWEKLPVESKKYFYDEVQFKYTLPKLEFCWPFIIKGEKTKLDKLVARLFRNQTTFNQYEFEHSAGEGIKAAAEYFFRKLTNAEKEYSLLRTAKKVVTSRRKNTDADGLIVFVKSESVHEKRISTVFFYLLSLMSHEQRMEVFKEYPCKTLIFLLDWPWQDLFLDIADLVWPFLTEIDYVDLLNRIAHKIIEGFHLTKLFQDFFLRGSSDFKKYFIDEECQNFFCFSIFLDNEEFDTIKLIFINADSADRKRLMTDEDFLDIFYCSLLSGYQRWLEMCLQEARLSKEDKELLKKSFFKFLKTTDTEKISSRDNIWETFCSLVDKSDGDALNKRNTVEENL